MVKTNDCEYAAQNGLCTGFMRTCCMYQSIIRRDEQEPELKRLGECYCQYPDVAVDRETEQAVRELAAGLNAWKGTESGESS